MRKSTIRSSEVIVGKWKTSIDAEERHFGFLKLADDWELEFPILSSADEIEPDTRLVWGVTDTLERCTAVTLPFGPPGSTYEQIPGTDPIVYERSFKAVGRATHVILGTSYVSDPSAEFVREIGFVPEPNVLLRSKPLLRTISPVRDISMVTFTDSCEAEKRAFASAHFAYFEPKSDAVFEIRISKLRAMLSGCLTTGQSAGNEPGNGALGFFLRFDVPQTLQAAIEEAYVLSVLLSFLSHHYVNPTRFRLLVDGEGGSHELYLPQWPTREKNVAAWAGYTLVLADAEPSLFREVLQRWYETTKPFLRSRQLYQYSLREPNVFSNERFLSVVRCLEGLLRMPSPTLFTDDELRLAETAVRKSLSSASTHSDQESSDKVEQLVRKLRSSNVKSSASVLKSEIPRILAQAHLRPMFDVAEFVNRVYQRRNKGSHGGAHSHADSFEELVNDTLLITAICLIVDAQQLGLEPPASLRKFEAVILMKLPLAST